MTELSERDVAVLAFERRWWKHAGAKEDAIRVVFDMSPTRYYAIVNRLLDSPEALAADPDLVMRLRRLRDGWQHGRGRRIVPGAGVGSP